MAKNQGAAEIIYNYQAKLDKIRFTADHKDQPIYVAEQLHVRRRLARWGILNTIGTRGAIELTEDLARWVCGQTDRSLKVHEAVYGAKQTKLDVKGDRIREHVANGVNGLARIAQLVNMDKEVVRKMIEEDQALHIEESKRGYFKVYKK